MDNTYAINIFPPLSAMQLRWVGLVTVSDPMVPNTRPNSWSATIIVVMAANPAPTPNLK